MKLLKKNDITSFLLENNLYDNNTYFIWGTIRNYYYIISFCNQGICLLPIAFSGNLKGEIYLLKKEKIELLDMKKNIFSYKLVIKPVDTDLERLVFTIRPFMIGYKGQKESIGRIFEKYFK